MKNMTDDRPGVNKITQKRETADGYIFTRPVRLTPREDKIRAAVLRDGSVSNLKQIISLWHVSLAALARITGVDFDLETQKELHEHILRSERF